MLSGEIGKKNGGGEGSEWGFSHGFLKGKEHLGGFYA
jgi:hypothetical protein